MFFGKDSANEWNGKRKDEVFLFHSRVQPILFKDSANEWNDKRKDEVFLLPFPSAAYIIQR